MVSLEKTVIPTPAPYLALSFEFHLPTEVKRVYASLKTEAVSEAVREACITTAWLAPEKADGRVRHLTSSSSPTFEDIHCGELDKWMCASGCKYEYIVMTESRRMVLRVLCFLPDLDGTLAIRIGLFAMQLLEGEAPRQVAQSPSLNPPLQWKLVPHSLNFICMLAQTLCVLFCHHFAWLVLGRSASKGDKVINTYSKLYRYYSSDGGGTERSRSTYYLYTWTEQSMNPYKRFVLLVDEWKEAVGLNSYFYLNNFSPRAAPGLTQECGQLLTRGGREKGIFDLPAAPPQGKAMWYLQNALLGDKIFVNNYGKYDFNFQAEAVHFVWDCLGLGAVHGAGGLTLNGKSLFWIRATKSSAKIGNTFMEKGGLGSGTKMHQFHVN